MAIHRLFQNTAFTPEDIAVMAAAFDDACRTLAVTERSGERAQNAARKIIECAQMGERDPARLRDCALKALRE
jgi:hypothetical protein